jgi:hypothetical protein
VRFAHGSTLPGCGPVPDRHGQSVDPSSQRRSDPRTFPHATDVVVWAFARFASGKSPNRTTSRDTTRLQLVAVCRSDWDDAYTPQSHEELRLRQPAYLSSFITGADLRGSGPLSDRALTTRQRVSWIEIHFGGVVFICHTVHLIKHPRSGRDPLLSQGSLPFLPLLPFFHFSISPLPSSSFPPSH